MEENIKYEFRSSVRAKRRITIHVHPDGRVVVTKPRLFPLLLAKQFADRKLPWIKERLEFYKTAPIFNWKDYVPDHKLAFEFVKSKINFYNQHYKFEVGSVGIKNYKSMWGACINRKNLVFNAKIAGLPEEQANYIIVHELCHLKEFNHSKNFWRLVVEQIPDYKRIKQALKLYSVY